MKKVFDMVKCVVAGVGLVYLMVAADVVARGL